MTAWLVERLVAAPNRTLNLLPGGQARAEQLTTLEVGEGTTRQTITAWSVSGLSNAPTPVWTDASGVFFGFYAGIAWLPAGYESALGAMEKAQNDALAVASPGSARSWPARRQGRSRSPTCSCTTRRYSVSPDHTVVMEKDRIVAVGPAGTTKVPAGAERSTGAASRLCPGCGTATCTWRRLHRSAGAVARGDFHPGSGQQRSGDDGSRERRDRGDLLFPHVYASSLIDGKGPYTAQVANVATSEAEAVGLVRRAQANGFIGVKFYGTLDPKWLPAAIGEAKKLGLHVHGHIPAGIRPLDAVNAGYDEITHINWIIMQAMPDSVIRCRTASRGSRGPADTRAPRMSTPR